MRVGATVVAMTVAALVLAALMFGPATLVVGVPLLVAIVVVLLAVRLSRAPRERLDLRRAAAHGPADPAQGGLMSGFFEVPAPRDPVAHRTART